MSSKYDISGTLHHSFQIGDGPTFYYGNIIPTSDIGIVGDVYILTEIKSGTSIESIGSIYIKSKVNNNIIWQQLGSSSSSQVDLSNYISVLKQSFTEEQKYQARENIGAGDLSKPLIQTTTETDITILAEPNTIYNCGELLNLNIDTSKITSVNDISEIYFSTNTTATNISFVNNDLCFGDDVSNNVFTPIINKRYDLMIFNDGLNTQVLIHGYTTSTIGRGDDDLIINQ